MRQSRIEYDKCAAESEKEMKALRTELAKLGNRLGDFVQEMVHPAAVRLFQERGLPVHRILPNMQYRSDDGQSTLEVKTVCRPLQEKCFHTLSVKQSNYHY